MKQSWSSFSRLWRRVIARSRQWLARRGAASGTGAETLGAAGDAPDGEGGGSDNPSAGEQNESGSGNNNSGEPSREEDDSREEENIPFFQRVFHSSTAGMDLSVLLKIKKNNPFMVSVIGDRAVVVCLDRNAKTSFFQSVFRDGPSFISCEPEVRSIQLMKYIKPAQQSGPEVNLFSSVIKSTIGKNVQISPPRMINLSDPLAIPLKDGFVGLDFPVYGHTSPFPFMMVKTDPSMIIPHYDGSPDEEENTAAGDDPRTGGEENAGGGPAEDAAEGDSRREEREEGNEQAGGEDHGKESGEDTRHDREEDSGEEKPKYFRLVGRVLWSEEDIRSFFGRPETEPVSEELREEAADYIRGLIWRYCRVLARQVNTVHLLRRKRGQWQIVRSNNQIYSTFFLDPDGDKEVLHFISGYFDNYWGKRLFMNLALIRPDDLKVVEHLQRVAQYWD